MAKSINHLELQCPLLTPLKRTGQVSKVAHFINQDSNFRVTGSKMFWKHVKTLNITLEKSSLHFKKGITESKRHLKQTDFNLLNKRNENNG